jgi:hypothetical protein
MTIKYLVGRKCGSSDLAISFANYARLHTIA